MGRNSFYSLGDSSSRKINRQPSAGRKDWKLLKFESPGLGSSQELLCRTLKGILSPGQGSGSGLVERRLAWETDAASRPLSEPPFPHLQNERGSDDDFKIFLRLLKGRLYRCPKEQWPFRRMVFQPGEESPRALQTCRPAASPPTWGGRGLEDGGGLAGERGYIYHSPSRSKK